MTYTITANKDFNSLEVKFDGKPSDAIRDALKSLKFRWHGVKKIWYGYKTEEEVKTAIDAAENGNTIQENGSAKKSSEKPAKKNKFGVKVGDLFSASWGYEQTNVDFFQVIALVGETSVRVREVNPPMIEDTACGPMAADRKYKVKGLEILPPAHSSVFINDQEKGDLKRLKSYAKDGISNPQFYLASFTDAHYCGNEIQKTYESWYY